MTVRSVIFWAAALFSTACIQENAGADDAGPADVGSIGGDGPVGFGDAGGADAGGEPRMEVSPSVVFFPAAPVGQLVRRDVAVGNSGSATLEISRPEAELGPELAVHWLHGEAGGEKFPGVDFDGTNAFPASFVLEPGDAITLVFEYQPRDEMPDRGTLSLESNGGRAVITVETGVSGPRIQVAPAVIDFGRVGAGDRASETVTVANLGFGPLTVSDLRIDGSPDFAAQVSGDADLADPDGDGAPGLAPQGQFDIDVGYAPANPGAGLAKLVIANDDPEHPEVRVRLRANADAPCISVAPEELELPPTPVGEHAVRPVIIESCGGEPLELSAIAPAEDSDPAFALDPESLPMFPAVLAGLAPGQPPASRVIAVVFTPPDASAYAGAIEIRSNDPDRPVVTVPLVGDGGVNECPVPRVASEEIMAAPLDVIELDGSPSVDPDGPEGRPVRYSWVVVERPAGSTATPVERHFDVTRPNDGGMPDDEATPVARLFLDLAGRYTIELQVEDDRGLSAPSDACPGAAAVVHVVAASPADVRVELTWRTPGDDDETDGEGSDVDLHFMNPQGQDWMDAPLDCFYANPSPDWGRLGDPADDPSLDIDDTNGAGPEAVTLSSPMDTGEAGGPYRVGVHYYREEDYLRGGSWGPSFATVRVFLDGELSWQNEEPKELRETDHFWEVGGVVLAAGEHRFEVSDLYFERVP